MVERYVGIDISKEKLDVATAPDAKHFTVENSPGGMQEFVAWLIDTKPSLVAFEHTGRLTRNLIEALDEAGIPAAAINAKQIRYFARVLKRETKTDKLDALTVAEFASLIRPVATTMPTKRERELQDMVARRRQIANDITKEKIRQKQHTSEYAQASLQRHILWMKDELVSIELAIDSQIDDNPDWDRRRQIITSLPGAGSVLAFTLISDLPELGHLTRKQISALVGVAPIAHESGQVTERKHIRGGRFFVRSMLYMASLSGTHSNPDMKTLFTRLRESGKPHMVARVAVMRKMLITLNAMVRDNRMWKEPIE